MIRYIILFRYLRQSGVFYNYQTVIEAQDTLPEIDVFEQAYKNFVRFIKLQEPKTMPFSIPETLTVTCRKEIYR